MRSRLGRPAANELEQGVGAQIVRVVLVVVAASHLKDALLEERDQRMTHPPAAPLRYMASQAFAQAELFVGLGQPQQAAIAGDSAAVESSLECKARWGVEAHRRGNCGTILHVGSLLCSMV